MRQWRLGRLGEVWGDLRALSGIAGFRRLFAVRLLSQGADGMFQVGLANLLFFSPESAGTAAAVAAGFAIMLAPFTVAGPFAGVFLDRWPRRNVLLYGNLARAALAVAMAALLALAARSGLGLVELLGLAALGANRFVLAGLSAALPNALADAGDGGTTVGAPDGGQLLLTANSLVPSLGAGAAFLGGGVGFALSLLPAFAEAAAPTSLALSALVMVAASVAAGRIGVGRLGPDRPPTTGLRHDLAKLVTEFRDAARYLVARATPAQALAATAAHRFLYGLVFIAAVLMSRNLLGGASGGAGGGAGAAGAELVGTDAVGALAGGGIGNFALIMALIGAGGTLAVCLTPVFARRLAPQAWVAWMFAVAALGMLVLSASPARAVVFTATLLLGLGSQGSKIAVDTIVQRDTADRFRGRAFALYDVVFNASFVAAAALAVFVVPDTGWSRPLFAIVAACYAATAALVYFRGARLPRPAG